MIFKFNSLSELIAAFPDEQTCIEYLEHNLWHGNVISPYDATSKVYKCRGNNYKCKNTGRYFNVKTNTLFHRSSIPLQKWFIAIWLISSHKKGISSVQLSKDIGVTQKTAWLMLHKIREVYADENGLHNDDEGSDGKLSENVEIDESFIGGKNKNRHRDKKVEKCQGRSFKDKVPVFGLLERGKRVIAKVVPNTRVKTLQSLIYKYVRVGSNLYSDEWDYGKDTDLWYYHRHVDHSKGFYGDGDLTSNGIESFWAVVKRSIMGIYYHWSKKYMQKYIDECVFRFNTRKITDKERFELFLQKITGNKITYKELIYAISKN